MTELPRKKVGIIACSGEEMAEGTITRLAALKVLEQLCPDDTVTICLPLFLAGGAGDRAFAKFYPTIAIDGCDKRCAYRGTELYSNKPAVGFVVTELVKDLGLPTPTGKRNLDEAGKLAVDEVARIVAENVDTLLGKRWSRRQGAFIEETPAKEAGAESAATCSCGSGIPIQTLMVGGQEETLIGLPAIFRNMLEAGKAPSESVLLEIMDMVKIYNGMAPARENEFKLAIAEAYQVFWDVEASSGKN